MFRSFLRRLRQFSRRIHVRVILFSVLALLALAAASVSGPYIPERLGDLVGASSVDRILNILASSMLAVTTFSLTIMLTALNNAAGQWTPRSHLILREDTITHSVLANFLGAFLFALTAIILRSSGLFDERGIVVLYGMTLAVVAIVVISLIRWIVHLEGLGSLVHTARMIETEAAAALARHAERPCHGGHPLTDPERQVPSGAHPLRARASGYLQQVFEDAIEARAEAEDLRVYLLHPVGQPVLAGAVIARVATRGGALPEDTESALLDCLPVTEQRGFVDDPLFGLTVMAEIATRALSPGVNDPGTAIDAVHRLARLAVAAGTRQPDSPACPRLWVPPLDPDAVFAVSFDAVARYAGDALEVHLALLRSLAQVADGAGDPAIAQAARACRARVAERARQAVTFGPDRERLDRATA